MERSRFSGSLSIKNQFNQLISATQFWIAMAVVLAVITTGSVGYLAAKKIESSLPGTLSMYLRYELYYTASLLDIEENWMKPDLLKKAEKENAQDILLTIQKVIKINRSKMKFAPILGGVVFIATLILGFIISRRERDLQTAELYKRGAFRYTAEILTKILSKNLGAGVIRIGRVLIPAKLENLSFFFIGRPQQGKTQVFLRILDEIIKRGDRALVWCAKQEDYITTHYNEQEDHVFCPGDERSVKWSLANDLSSLTDFENIAALIIPESLADSKGPWNKGAREILIGLMKYWWLNTDRSNAKLWEIVNAPISDLYQMLAATPDCGRAAGLFEKNDSNASYSFYITLITCIKPLELLAKNDGDFSICDYLQNGKGKIFILSGSRMKKSLQPVQTLFIDLFMSQLLDLQQDRARRVWFLLDELPALNKLPKLEELMNVGPSYGASVIIGTQSFALIDAVYEETGRRAIFNASNTSTIFSVADDKTAEELSTNLGMEEVSQPKQNYSISAKEDKGSTSLRHEDKERALYMPDEIKNLKQLNCIVRVNGFGSAETELKLKIWPQKHPAFVPDKRYSLEEYEAEFASLHEKSDKMSSSQKTKPSRSTVNEAVQLEKEACKVRSENAKKAINKIIFGEDVF